MTEESITYEQYDEWGRVYVEQERAFYADKSDPVYEYFKSTLAPYVENAVIADVGSGAGDELADYAALGAAEVFGIEPSSVMRNIANEYVNTQTFPIKMVPGTFESLPFSDNSIDMVTARYSLHILSTFEEAFREVFRVLKPNGLFLVAVSHPDFDAKLVRNRGQSIGERVQIKLFGGDVVVDNGTHTMDEYVGAVPSRYFICEAREAYSLSGDTYTDLVVKYRRR